ncbi:NAC transcription factor 29 [Morella rubra]|uniref:NAC transcription factor 29 n=1 Tax=Morella rubra TaxID=262757 RepID=A0A6A1WJS7_9ROSI|nr:NAC transcription factor 29 [Morella rubra]
MADSSADCGTLEDLVSGFRFRPTTSFSPTTVVVPDNPTMRTQVPDTAPDQSRPAEFDNTYSMPKSWFLDTIPPEFRFVPTDEELVLYYLLPKLKNFPLPAYPIPEVNLYGHSPDYFAGSPPNGKKTLWLMKEYTVGAPQPANQSMRLDDWVLCVIYKRPEKSNTRASVEETDQPINYIDLDVLANFDHQHQIGVDYETPTEVAEMNFDEIYDLFINQ